MASLLLLLPLLVIIIINLPLRGIRRTAIWFAGFICLLQAALVLYHPLQSWSMLSTFMETFLSFKISIDSLALVMLLCIALVELTAILVANATIPEDKRKASFVNLALIILIGMNAMVMLSDLFSIYIFLEIVAISSFILIAIKKDILALEGAFKYMMLSAIASVAMVAGLALLFMLAGGTSFSAIHAALAVSSNSIIAKIAIGLFVCGLFIKSGVVPFHGWLPDAYCSAPTAVSILLAGIITKISGVYVLIRLVISVFGFSAPLQNILMLAGIASILVGALAALVQSNFKRMLAYSSISQVGYIILGLGCGTPLAIAGAVLHFFNHATFKALLFTNAAALEQRLDSVDMDKMGGVAQKMPITGLTSVIAFLSTAGIPPLSGFWSKFMIVLALWMAGNHLLAGIALLASILTAAYFLSMQRRVFFGKMNPSLGSISEASPGLILPMLILSAIIIGVGLCFPFIIGKFVLAFNSIV
ncbi:MAG: proton-conducting transporter membrane subunit [Candidatus Margulisiibacteriota bacterium]